MKIIISQVQYEMWNLKYVFRSNMLGSANTNCFVYKSSCGLLKGTSKKTVIFATILKRILPTAGSIYSVFTIVDWCLSTTSCPHQFRCFLEDKCAERLVKNRVNWDWRCKLTNKTWQQHHNQSKLFSKSFMKTRALKRKFHAVLQNTSCKIKLWIPSRTSAVPETQLKYAKQNNTLCLILSESLSLFITLLGIAHHYQLILINCFLLILVIACYPFPHHWLIHHFQQHITDLILQKCFLYSM